MFRFLTKLLDDVYVCFLVCELTKASLLKFGGSMPYRTFCTVEDDRLFGSYLQLCRSHGAPRHASKMLTLDSTQIVVQNAAEEAVFEVAMDVGAEDIQPIEGDSGYRVCLLWALKIFRLTFCAGVHSSSASA